MSSELTPEAQKKKKTVWGIKIEKTFAHVCKDFPLQ